MVKKYKMYLPIYVYGHPVLRKVATPVDKDYPALEKLIEDMWETMYKADGVGLAAPQIGKPIRLFVIDGSELAEKDENLKGFKKTFINAEILTETGEDFTYSEGCLSVPGIREEIIRPSIITVRYMDENFKLFEEQMEGLKARIVQHEHDHLQGKLLIDRINPIRRTMLQGKLNNISRGKVECDYKIKTAK